MASNQTIILNEDAILDEMIRLEGDGFDTADRDEIDNLDDYAEPMIWVHHEKGHVILVEVDRFKTMTEVAVQELRANPLPWVFTVASLGIKEKPLEDVLLAAWEKYKNLKVIGD